MPKAPTVPRRHALKILGAATVAPAVAEGAWMFHPLVPPQADGGPWRPRFFTVDESAAVETLAELIIPETDTPGARAANVHQYIDWIVSRAAEDGRIADDGANDGDASLPAVMRDGLAWFDRRTAALYGRRFIEATSGDQTALLERLAADPVVEEAAGVAFFRETRRLTIHGYYRSEIGMREELGYDGKRYLTGFEGCTHDEHLSWEPEDTDNAPAGSR